jgi:hypothetical protein
MTCTVVNNGDVATSSLVYGVPITLTVVGPTGVCAGHSTCGSVTVATTLAGNTIGTLVVTPSSGTYGSQAINLTQVDPPPHVFGFGSPSVTVNNRVDAIWTFSNSDPMPVTITGVDLIGVDGDVTLSGTCTTGGSLAPGGTCTVRATALPECFSYSFGVSVSNAAGAATPAQISGPKPTKQCNVISQPSQN